MVKPITSLEGSGIKTEMARSFPLYDSLLAESKDGSIDWKNYTISLNCLGEDHRNVIMAIIIHKHLLDGGSRDSLPTGCSEVEEKKKKFGVKVVPGSLPMETQRVILAYLKRITS